jgi:hypothetical protein
MHVIRRALAKRRSAHNDRRSMLYKAFISCSHAQSFLILLTDGEIA